MSRLRVCGDEAFYPRLGFRAGRSAVAQVFNKAGIVRGKAAEFGPGHPGFSQELFNLAYQHGHLSLTNRRISSLYVPS
jgi:hypothetical protein